MRAPPILTIFCIRTFFELIHIASASLQSSTTDIGAMASIIATLREKLNKLKSDAKCFEEIFKKGKEICDLNEIEMLRPRNRRRSHHLDEFVVPLRAGVAATKQPEGTHYDLQFMRSYLWDPFLDTVLKCLDQRFSPDTMLLADGVNDYVTFKSEETLDKDKHDRRCIGYRENFIGKYSKVPLLNGQILCYDELESQYKEVRTVVLREEERRRFTANSKFEKLSGKAHSLLFFMVNDRTCLSLSCPLYFEYLCLDCTIPFTSASNKRAFSKLKLIKDRLRSTMVDSRMCSKLNLFHFVYVRLLCLVPKSFAFPIK